MKVVIAARFNEDVTWVEVDHADYTVAMGYVALGQTLLGKLEGVEGI